MHCTMGLWGYSTKAVFNLNSAELDWITMHSVFHCNMQCIAPRSSMCFSQCNALHLSELLCSAMSCWDILVHCWISCITGRNIPWGGLAANAGVGDIWDQFSTQDSTVSHQSPLDQAFDFNTSLLLLPLNSTKSRTVGTFALIGKYGAIYKIPNKRIFWANIVQNCQSRFYRIGPRLFLKPNSQFGKINQKQRGQNRKHMFLSNYIPAWLVNWCQL